MRKLLGLIGAVVLAACAQAPDDMLVAGNPAECRVVVVAGLDICSHATAVMQAVEALQAPGPGGEAIQQVVGEEHPAVVLAGGV